MTVSYATCTKYPSCMNTLYKVQYLLWWW